MKKKNYGFCTYRELCKKDVINKQNGKKLGHVCDMGLDPCTGRILNLIVPNPDGSWIIRPGEEIIIPFDAVEKFGEDVIIVNTAMISSGVRE